MSDKILHIKFRNAKLFIKDNGTKDFVFNVGGYGKRKDRVNGNFVEPITVHQVSNLLHVLMGERPVPSFRKSFYPRVENIFNIAQNGYLKIDTPTEVVKRKDGEVTQFIGEVTTLNKSAWDSWTKPSNIQWYKIEKYFGEELFKEFITKMNKAVGYNVTHKPFMELLNITNKFEGNLFDDILEFLLINKKTPIINFITKDVCNISEVTMNYRTLGETVVRGIDNAKFLSGEIYLPMDDEYINKLKVNTATILDGGLATIVDVIDSDDFYESDIVDFSKISDISDTKY